MTKYEKLLMKAQNQGAEVMEVNLGTNKRCGKCINKYIVINSELSNDEKYCVLAEELGHYNTTYGNIVDNNINSKKKEVIARRWGYETIVGISNILQAHKEGCKNLYEVAEFIGITEEFLIDALKYYQCKYPDGFEIDNYWLDFNNGLEIIERI